RGAEGPVARRARGRSRQPDHGRDPSRQPVRLSVPSREVPGRRLADPAQLRGGAPMKFYPALDIMQGKAVRLEAGRRMSATIFHEWPIQLVPHLTADGADGLHLVDLDGAFGEQRQLMLLQQIIKSSPIPVQVGGGIRDAQAVDQMFQLGATYVILGTA